MIKAIVAVVLCALIGLGGFVAGAWYGGYGVVPAEIAYGALSGLADATDRKIIADYERSQRELADEAKRRRQALEQTRARRIQSEQDAEAANLELARANETIEALQKQAEVADRELMAALARPAQTEQAADLQAKAARAVHLLKQENEHLRGVVRKQRVVIERQALVISEFKSEVAEYERNLVLWKDRYKKAEKHINRFGSRRSKIAAAVMGAAAGVYVGMKVF